MVKSKGFIQIPILIVVILIVGSVIAGVFLLGKNPTTSNWQWVNEQDKLYELTPAEINLILKEVWDRFPDKMERLKALAILRLGTPYQFGCLGEESGRDKDPIFRLDVTDCTAFVLTNVALVFSRDLEKAGEMMKYLNYRPDSEITYENRLHFTFDRNAVSPYFQDITEQILKKDELITRKVILNRIKKDGKRLIDIDWEKDTILKYIPNEYITENFLSGLPQACGVAFIKEENFAIGLDVVHEGFLFDERNLIHASSAQEKVVKVDFLD